MRIRRAYMLIQYIMVFWRDVEIQKIMTGLASVMTKLKCGKGGLMIREHL